MTDTPKTLEDLLIWLVCAVTAGLAVAVVSLAKYIVVQLAKKDAEHNKLRNDFDKFRDSQLTETRDMVREATKAALKGEERERLLSKMVAEVMAVMAEQKDVIYRAVKLLRRYDPNATPPPEIVHRPDFEHKKEPKRDKRITDDDTSAIFRPTEDIRA